MAFEIRAHPSDRTKTPEEVAEEEKERLERLEVFSCTSCSLALQFLSFESISAGDKVCWLRRNVTAYVAVIIHWNHFFILSLVY